MNPSDFFNLTPAEYSLLLTFNDDKKRKEQSDLQLKSWFHGYYSRVKKLPNVKDIWNIRKRKKTKKEKQAILDRKKSEHEEIMNKFSGKK